MFGPWFGSISGRSALLLAGAALTLALAACGPPPEPAPPPGKKPQKVLTILDRLAEDSEGLPTRWERLSSANFTIYFLKYSGVARLILDTAEEARQEQLAEWGIRIGPWSPRCAIYFYPTRKVMVRMTAGTTTHGSAQAPASRLVKGRLRYRRINLAANDRGILDDTVPHELSHLILSELMAPRRPPRWADEGLAMRTESRDTQVRWARSMYHHLARGRRPFPLGQLFAMTRYPDNKHLFYNQSFLVIRALRKVGSLARVLAFLKDSADLPALQRHFSLTEGQLNKLLVAEMRRLARQ